MNFLDIFDRYNKLVSKLIDDTFNVVTNSGKDLLPGYPDPAISAFTKITKTDIVKMVFLRMGNNRPSFGAIVGVDGEYPLIKKFATFSEEDVKKVKLAIATEYLEADYELLHDMELYQAASRNDYYNQMLDQILLTPAKLTEAITILATKLLIDLFYGSCQYIDRLTGLGWEMSYLADVPIENKPLALTGVSLWTASTTAKPLEDLSAHLRAYYRNARRMPDAIAMPSAIAEFILACDDTKLKIIRQRGYFGTTTPELMSSMGRPTLDDVVEWLKGDIVSFSSVALPKFIVSDAVYSPYQVDSLTNNTTFLDVPFLRSDHYVFLTKNVVEGSYTPTATNDFKSPLAFYIKDDNAPKKERSSVDTNFIGYCINPKVLGWRKVI